MEFIAAHAAAKIACYLWMLLKQLGYEQKDLTPIHIDNLPALRMINDNSSPTKRTRHIDYWYFQIQDWRIDGDIIMLHISGILNISDAETKSLGFVLHSWHCRQMVGHYDWWNQIKFYLLKFSSGGVLFYFEYYVWWRYFIYMMTVFLPEWYFYKINFR